MVNVFFLGLKIADDSEAILCRTPLQGCAGAGNAEGGQMQRSRVKSIPYHNLNLLLLTDLTVLSELSMFLKVFTFDVFIYIEFIHVFFVSMECDTKFEYN